MSKIKKVNNTMEVTEHENPDLTLNDNVRSKIEDNLLKFAQEDMMNHRNACYKGRLFDEINSYTEKIFCFPVRSGVSIDIGDTAMIDRYCEVYPYQMLSDLNEDDAIFSELIGNVVAKACTSDGIGQDVVFVRNSMFFEFKNTDDVQYRIKENDLGAPCFLDQKGRATSDGLNVFAGQIYNVINDIVTVYVNLERGDD